MIFCELQASALSERSERCGGAVGAADPPAERGGRKRSADAPEVLNGIS
jgi:hypothetical protein